LTTVAKLEALLGRIQKNRRSQASAALREAPTQPPAHPVPVGLPAVARAAPVAVAQPKAAPPPEVELAPSMEEMPMRAPRPTPMEMALEEGFDGPDVQMEEVEITIDDGDEDMVASTPTAPVEMRAPVEARPPVELRAAIVEAPRQPEQRAALHPAAAEQRATPPAETELEPIEARPIPIPALQPSAPVVRAVSPAPSIEPLTFGQLLDRTLSLRKKR
jgi:hypothetical protein